MSKPSKRFRIPSTPSKLIDDIFPLIRVCRQISRTSFEARIMIEKSTHRLGEYQISEYGNGVLWWHAHHGLGQQRSGRCFVHGDFLVIGQFSHEENGYLKGEFLDRLKKLPLWKKTKFYCFASELTDVSSGRTITEDSENRLYGIQKINGIDVQAGQDKASGTFRLERYKVTVAASGQISWQALEGSESVVGGQCFVQSGILFIGPREYDKRGQSRREFLQELNEIPTWNRTRMWGHSLALRPCEPQAQTGHIHRTAQDDTSQDHRFPGSTYSSFWKAAQKALTSLRPPDIRFKVPPSPFRRASNLKFPTPTPSSQSLRKAGFLVLIPLLFAGLILGLILGVHSWEEKLHHHHTSEKHHHR